MGSDQFPSPFKLKSIYNSTKKQHHDSAIGSRSEISTSTATATQTPISKSESKAPSHSTPTQSFLNIHQDSQLTIHNDTMNSTLKFQSQDAENVIDWIDSLKSRFHELKNNQTQELNELIDTNNQVNKIEQLKEKYKTMHFDEDFVKLGDLLERQQEGDIDIDIDDAEEEEQDEDIVEEQDEEEEEVVSDDDSIQIISDEDDIIEIQDDEEDEEPVAAPISQIHQLDYNTHYQNDPYAAYRNDNYNQTSQYQQEIEYDDESEELDHELTGHEYNDMTDHNQQQNLLFNYELENQLNNHTGYGITQIPSYPIYNGVNGRPRLSDTYNYQSEESAEESEEIIDDEEQEDQEEEEEEEEGQEQEDENEEDEDQEDENEEAEQELEQEVEEDDELDNNFFAQQGNEDEPIELESSEAEDEVEEGEEGEEGGASQNEDYERMDEDDEQSEDVSVNDDGSDSDDDQENINESVIEGYEAGIDEEEDEETEDANNGNVYLSNPDLLSLATTAILQNKIHEHKFKLTSSGYMADSEFTDNKTPKEELEITTNDEADDTRRKNSKFTSEETAPVPQPFYAHELNEEKMIAIKYADEYISEGSLADESQFESMKDDVNPLHSEAKVNTEEQVNEPSSDEEPPLPIFKTVEEEDPEVVLEKLKETEKKYHIKLNAVEDLEREIRSSSQPSRDVTISHFDESSEESELKNGDDVEEFDNIEYDEESQDVVSEDINDVIDLELQEVMENPIDRSDVTSDRNVEEYSQEEEEEEEELTIIEPPPVEDFILPEESTDEEQQEQESVEKEEQIESDNQIDQDKIINVGVESELKDISKDIHNVDDDDNDVDREEDEGEADEVEELTVIYPPIVEDIEIPVESIHEDIEPQSEAEHVSEFSVTTGDTNNDVNGNDQPDEMIENPTIHVEDIPVPEIEPIPDQESNSSEENVEILDEQDEKSQKLDSEENNEEHYEDHDSQELDVKEPGVQQNENEVDAENIEESHEVEEIESPPEIIENIVVDDITVPDIEPIENIAVDDITVPEIESIVEEQSPIEKEDENVEEESINKVDQEEVYRGTNFVPSSKSEREQGNVNPDNSIDAHEEEESSSSISNGDETSNDLAQVSLISGLIETFRDENYEEIRIESEIESPTQFELPVVEIGEHFVEEIVEQLVQQLEDEVNDEYLDSELIDTENNEEDVRDSGSVLSIDKIECPQLEQINESEEEESEEEESEEEESEEEESEEEESEEVDDDDQESANEIIEGVEPENQEINESQVSEEEIPSIVVDHENEEIQCQMEKVDNNLSGNDQMENIESLDNVANSENNNVKISQEQVSEITVESNNENLTNLDQSSKEMQNNEDEDKDNDNQNSFVTEEDTQEPISETFQEGFVQESETMDIDNETKTIEVSGSSQSIGSKRSIEHEEESSVKRFKSAIASFFTSFKKQQSDQVDEPVPDISGDECISDENSETETSEQMMDEVNNAALSEEEEEEEEEDNDDEVDRGEPDSFEIHSDNSSNSDIQVEEILESNLGANTEVFNSNEIFDSEESKVEISEIPVIPLSENTRMIFSIPGFAIYKRPAIRRRRRRRRHIRLTPNFLNKDELEQALEFTTIQEEAKIEDEQQEQQEQPEEQEEQEEQVEDEIKNETDEHVQETVTDSKNDEMQSISKTEILPVEEEVLDKKSTKMGDETLLKNSTHDSESDIQILEVPKIRQTPNSPRKSPRKKHLLGLDLEEIIDPSSPKKTRDGASYGEQQTVSKRRLRSHDKKGNVSNQSSPILQKFDISDNGDNESVEVAPPAKQSNKKTRKSRRKTSEDIKGKPASRTRSKSPLKETMSEIIGPLLRSNASKTSSSDKRVSSLGSGKPYEDDTDRGRSRDR